MPHATGEHELIRPFPVVAQQTLRSADRLWFGARRREELELPERKPGFVRVFEANGVFLREHEGPGGLTMPHAVGAVSVLVVDMRPRTLSVEIDLKPPAGAEICTLKVDFRCRVLDAETVARLRLVNLFPELHAWINRGQRIRWLLTNTHLERLNEVYQLVHQRLYAQFCTVPPDIPGVQIRFVGVHIVVA